jgi:hypothetical protein
MVREICKADDFDSRTIASHYQDLRDDEIRYVVSADEMRLICDVNPILAQRIIRNTGLTTYQPSKTGMIEQAQNYAAFLISTIDNSFFTGILRRDIVSSKVRNLEQMFEANGEKSPITQQEITNENIRDIAFETKQLALAMAKRFEGAFKESVTMTATDGKDYVSQIAALLGADLEKIVVYGSSANGNGKDIDLLLIMRALERNMYDKVWAAAGRMKSDKKIGIVMLPSTHLAAYAQCEPNSFMVAHHGLLVYGEAINFPVLDERGYQRKIYYSIGKNFSSLRSAAGNLQQQLKMQESPKLLREILKLEIWIRRAIKQKELGEILTKEEFLEIEPVPIPNVSQSQSLETIRSFLYQANCRVKDRIHEYMTRTV